MARKKESKKTFNIGFIYVDEPGGCEREDETQFDVCAGNEIELLELFGQFIAECHYTITAISYVEEVPYDGE